MLGHHLTSFSETSFSIALASFVTVAYLITIFLVFPPLVLGARTQEKSTSNKVKEIIISPFTVENFVESYDLPKLVLFYRNCCEHFDIC